MPKISVNAVLISFFLLFLLQFFHLSFYPYEFFGRGRAFFTYLLPILLLANGKSKNDKLMGKPLFALYLLFICINIVSCYYIRGQSFFVSLVGWTNFFFVFYYITFRSWKQSLVVWENVIEYVYILLLILFALKNAFLDWDFIVTDLSSERLEKEMRVRIFSDAMLELGYLYCLNKFLVFKKANYLILALLGFLFMFLQGFRMMIAVGLIISAIMIIRVYKLTVKRVVLVSLSTIIIVSASIAIGLQTPIVRERLEELIERNEESNFNNEDYIRVVDVNFTYTRFFHNTLEMILGAGRTSVYNLHYSKEKVEYPSAYSKERSMLATYNHYYPVDLGFWGLSWESGIPFTIVAILIFLYPLLYKVPKEYYYANLYGLFMILIGVTNAQGYYQCNLIYIAIVYTIVEKANKVFKKKELFQKSISVK